MKTNINKKTKDLIILLIRISLLISILINIFMSLISSNFFQEISIRGELIFSGLAAFVLSFIPYQIEKKKNIYIPEIFEIIIVLFIYASIFLSAAFNLYYKFFWWDDLLHTLSGVIAGLIGSVLIYKLNSKYSMDLNPILVAIFSFCFAATIGVLWEVWEFSSDVFLGTACQKWDLPSTEIMIGKPYQGSGLRDTMSDLIVDCVGGLATSTVTYFIYKNDTKREERLKFIDKIFGNNNTHI